MSTSTTSRSRTGSADQVDVRGPRFAAWITTGVLVAVLVLSTFSLVAAGLLLAAQAVVFGLGAARGPRNSPYGQVFARFVAPRLSPTTEREPVAPLRFAQLVGLVFAVVGVAGFLTGLTVVGTVATGFALFAALLNAAFAFCLGCQIYPLVARFRRSTSITAA
ncbi:hypothetical protein ABIC28_003715 [Rhodococcus sp. PvR044]|jgi:hypothetical protein|uniref:DUF4395 domain-containing protein n=1 Tax=Rhodococcus oryzae TaxID=2571143 RepID=A0ABY2RHJ5_9NOCA|nr:MULTISPECIES: DUF4395 domain-containing protein [Rhodococcus]MBP1160585.1 hypothetical protein [Rhodococcus sp. PvR099]MCZ4556333.1 DUF4395 domain-containing protein [Rhodococcus maanshanensis]TJZ76644.1 DUF4395 domain-containing protein [Rhodococcus oryzae]